MKVPRKRFHSSFVVGRRYDELKVMALRNGLAKRAVSASFLANDQPPCPQNHRIPGYQRIDLIVGELKRSRGEKPSQPFGCSRFERL
jgi:hypothetical protein